MRVVSSGTSLKVMVLYFGVADAPVVVDRRELDVRAGHLLHELVGPAAYRLAARTTSSPIASMYFFGRIIPSVESERDR